MRKRLFIVGVILTLLLSGCGFKLIENGDEAWLNKKNQKTETSVERDNSSNSKTDNSSQPDNKDSAHYVDLGDADIPDGYIGIKLNDGVFVGKPETGRYHRSQLNAEEQAVYDELYVIIENMLGEAEVSSLDAATIEKAQKAVINDFPEFFYYTNYQYLQYTLNDELQKITVVANYTMSADMREKYQEIIDSYIDTFMQGINSGMSDYDIALSLYEFIAYNTDYVNGCAENQNILSVICYGQSVCTGYAKTYQYIMDRLGYESIFVTGYGIRTGELHAWLIVKLDGDYYYIDPTWGDSSTDGLDKSVINPMTVNYGFFCIPDEWLARTHIMDTMFTYPKCSATKDHYYIKNNAYITSKDDNDFKRIFNAESSYSDVVSFRCDSEDIFEYWKKTLFDESGILSYLQPGQTISYTFNEDTYVISILLN